MSVTRAAIDAVIFPGEGIRPVDDEDAAAFSAIPLGLSAEAFRAEVVAVLSARFGVAGPGFRVRALVECLRGAG